MLKERRQRSVFRLDCGHHAPVFETLVDSAGRIEAVLPAGPRFEEPAAAFASPGLVDIQVNGFAGLDFNAPGLTADSLDAALEALLGCGVTRCLPTLITASEHEILARLSALDRAVTDSRLGPLMVMGYHIEGPFLSRLDGYSGCHPADAMVSASMGLVERLRAAVRKPIRILTLAPEVAGAIELIRAVRALGITCAIGHTAAGRDAVRAAVGAGATLSTHLGNGLPHQLAKNENPLVVQLGEDRLFASFIADGIHIPRDLLQSWLRAKTVARSILITDASAGAGPGTSPGLYTMGPQEIERSADGVVRIPGSPYLAGSSASMDELVRHVMAWFGYGWSDVIRMCRINPLHAVAEPNTLPAAGAWADVVEWTVGADGPRVARAHLGPWTWHAPS